MRLKITRISIVGESGTTNKRPANMYVASIEQIEEQRKKLKENDDDIVRFNFEEVEE